MAVREGDRGPQVAAILRALVRLRRVSAAQLRGQDPVPLFDAELTAAVRRFQRDRGLTVDGVVDALTARTLRDARRTLGERTLVYRPPTTISGDDVGELQVRLTKLGYEVGTVDGTYGPATVAAVRAFQLHRRLPLSGVFGPKALRELNSVSEMVASGAPNTYRREFRQN